MAVHQFLLTIFAIHRYLLFLATTIRRIPQQQVLRGSIESKAYLSYAADSVGAQLTPLTQLVGPKNLRCALVVVYVLFFSVQFVQQHNSKCFAVRANFHASFCLRPTQSVYSTLRPLSGSEQGFALCAGPIACVKTHSPSG